MLETGKEAAPAPARYRSIFLSDVHLGSPRAQAELLLDFLARTQAEYLYLVGDIVDDGRQPRHEHWPEAHRAVLDVVRRKAGEGTRVDCLPSNHDGCAEAVWGAAARELVVASELEHRTADGRRLWVVHGDAFDAAVLGRRWLSRLGDAGARALEHVGRACERVGRGRNGTLGLRLKELGKRWLGYTRRFERTALRAARARRVDGVICGHVHSGASRTVEGLYYGNGGDWVGSASALVEHADGRFRLLRWARAA